MSNLDVEERPGIEATCQWRVSWRLGLALVFLSLAPRLVVLGVFSNYEVPPVYDEGGYFLRVQGAALALGSLPDFSKDGFYSWFGGGKWPPLYPLMLSLGFPLFEDNVIGARFVNVVLSACTTLLVFLIAKQLTGNRRVALAAAALHIVHPTIIAYSVFLWSETAFTFFLMLGVYFLLAALSSESGPGKRNRYLLAGAMYGATALVRAASVPLFLLLPPLIFWLERRRGGHLRQAAWLPFAIFLVVLPYELALCAIHKKFVLLSTASDYNLYLGNNPWVPLENGSSWGDNPSKSKVHRTMNEGGAAGELARTEIVSHPGRFLLRSVFRWRMLWSPDFFPIRHVLSAAAPPTYISAVALLAIVTLAAFVLVFGWGIFGLLTATGLQPGAKAIVWALCAALSIGPMATIAMSRLHFSMTVLLLPFAALGVRAMFDPLRRRNLLAGVVAAGAVVFSLSSLPVVFEKHLLVSSYYAPTLTPLAKRLARPLEYEDIIVFKAESQGPTVDFVLKVDPSIDASYLSPYESRAGWEAKKLAQRRPVANDVSVRLQDGEEIEVSLAGRDRSGAFQLSIENKAGGVCDVQLTPENWKRWQATSVPGIVYRWD